MYNPIRNSGPFRRRGFTLTEVMVVVSIMAMAVAIFSTSFPAAGQALYRGRHMDIAGNACSQQLEFWKNVGYGSTPAIPAGNDSIAQSFTPPNTLPGAVGKVTFTHLGDDFMPTSSGTDQLRIDVSIEWGGTGIDRGKVSLTSLMVR